MSTTGATQYTELSSTVEDPRFPARDDVVTAALLERYAKEKPTDTFVVFRDETWDYERTARETWSAAEGFIGLGIRPGDYVLSWLPNGKDALRTWFGSNAAGAVYAPINQAYRGGILEHTINVAGAEVMVAHASLVERLGGLNTPKLKTVIVVGGTAEHIDGLELLPVDVLERPGASRPVLERDIEPWDVMALIYTSGTTGPSKGVICTYLHHHTFCDQLLPESIGPDDRFFVCVPMFHASGTTSTYGMLQRGGSIVVTEGFDTSRYWEDVRRYGVTMAYIMAAMANFLYKAPASPDDADNPMRIAYVGPMIPYVDDFRRRFGVDVYTTYATTEAACPIVSDFNPKNWESCGRSVPGSGFEVRIVDDFDREVAPGEVGEMIVRHDRPWSMNAGYKDMPDATARAWRNGWFHTGDALKVDEQGDYYFVDRVKDAIRRRGENISSMEVEKEILAHPAVLEAAVIGVASELGEDDVKAVLVLQPGEELDPAELIQFLIPRMSHFMVPRYIEVVDEMPKTPSLKIQKFELRARGNANAWDREAAGIKVRREKL